jgi:hypothetical protein
MGCTPRTPPKLTSLALVALLAAAAFLLGRATAGLGQARRSVETFAEAAPSPTARTEAGGCAEAPPLRRRVSELEQRTRALALLLAAGHTAPLAPPSAEPSPPLAFPRDLAAPATPEQFRAAATTILAGCFPELQVQDAECSEYPCIAWSSYDATRPANLDLGGCEAWSRTMGERTFLYGRTSADGTTGFLGVTSMPEDPALFAIARQRFEQRMASLSEAYGLPAR